MTVMIKRWYRSRRNQVVMFIILMGCLIYYVMISNSLPQEPNLDLTRSTVEKFHGRIVADYNGTVVLAGLKRSSIVEFIEKKLQEALKYDKGTGCEIPVLDPFNKEVTQFLKEPKKVTCKGQDWVKCYFSECRVVQEILDTTRDIVCTYRDIIYESDQKYYLGSPVDVYMTDPYTLTKSDHVKIKCVGTHLNSILPSKWNGVAVGYRKDLPSIPPPKNPDPISVLIFGYDSLSKNGFIRRMPKTHKYIVEQMEATILHGYNIVGDGTPAALFPILSGYTELEMPDVRKKVKNNNHTLDIKKFIFHRVKQHGYRTAYYEDSPWIGTFQYRFNGFNGQPADHYLRAFFQEDAKTSFQTYCVGDTPRHRIMMNITEQFLHQPDPKFIFTFIADVTHDNINMISWADDATVDFLTNFKRMGRHKDTLLLFMGDHGTRYANVRKTLQGRLEERLPVMAILLPENLVKKRPSASKALEHNAGVLTTPHDVHAMILDALGLSEQTRDYRVAGADLPRAMSLLEPIPKNRSCSEAGIEPHWCACVSWKNVTVGDPMHDRVANALVDFINELTLPVRDQCVPRTLTSISWVMKQQPNKGVMEFKESKDADGYVGAFGPSIKPITENYQVKITVGPGTGVYEATLTHRTAEEKFTVDVRDISRTNMYHHEPDCIHLTHPHLNMFCYCKNQVKSH
ncbi:uncharacterized protein LOC114353432 isoform X2 [Ostrinia furnacalis]|uniref:uncharacterized protein LOC114353432 isoform X1 n=1 Tax=Ostrinia furnacalis TaxID=93504 RepID=UPI001039086B|nr:uncharacterized protein LOC114353432 isoform X1 [Ostrinia furnacalis]XP_028161247.1 uncharacterized protein LOC114353432 isoform X2 [Ostrinia furnacalis]